MTQEFALHYVATRSAYKIIWMAMQKMPEIILFLPPKSFYMHFQSQHNATQTLALYYKPAFKAHMYIVHVAATSL